MHSVRARVVASALRWPCAKRRCICEAQLKLRVNRKPQDGHSAHGCRKTVTCCVNRAASVGRKGEVVSVIGGLSEHLVAGLLPQLV